MEVRAMSEDDADIVARLKKLDLTKMLMEGDRSNLVERMSSTLGTGGPHGIGHPADKTLTDYELDVLIPQRALETTKLEMCGHLMKEFNECADKQVAGIIGKISFGIGMHFNCNSTEVNNCYRAEFYNPSLFKAVRDEYLNERSHLRNTGIKTIRFHHGRFLKRPESDGPSLDKHGQYRPRKPECWDETYGDSQPSWASYHYDSP